MRERTRHGQQAETEPQAQAQAESGVLSAWSAAAREKARALLPAPDDLSQQAYIAEVVAAALAAASPRDREQDVRLGAERIARHAWEALRPRLARGKPID